MKNLKSKQVSAHTYIPPFFQSDSFIKIFRARGLFAFTLVSLLEVLFTLYIQHSVYYLPISVWFEQLIGLIKK